MLSLNETKQLVFHLYSQTITCSQQSSTVCALNMKSNIALFVLLAVGIVAVIGMDIPEGTGKNTVPVGE